MDRNSRHCPADSTESHSPVSPKQEKPLLAFISCATLFCFTQPWEHAGCVLGHGVCCVRDATSSASGVICVALAWLLQHKWGPCSISSSQSSLLSPQGSAGCFLEQLPIIAFPEPVFTAAPISSTTRPCFPHLTQMEPSCSEGLPSATASRKKQASLQVSPERWWQPHQLILPFVCRDHVCILSGPGWWPPPRPPSLLHLWWSSGQDSALSCPGSNSQLGMGSLQPPQVPDFSWGRSMGAGQDKSWGPVAIHSCSPLLSGCTLQQKSVLREGQSEPAGSSALQGAGCCSCVGVSSCGKRDAGAWPFWPF